MPVGQKLLPKYVKKNLLNMTEYIYYKEFQFHIKRVLYLFYWIKVSMYPT